MMENDYRWQIGRRISELRAVKGLSQSALAELTGLKQQNIARIELGRYSTGIDIIASICEALGCEVEIVEKKVTVMEDTPSYYKIDSVETALKATRKTMPDFTGLPDRYKALFEMETIVEAVNEGWEPNWTDDDEPKWIPQFRTPCIDLNFAFDYSELSMVSMPAGCGEQLHLRCEKRSDYVGEKFLPIWERILFG